MKVHETFISVGVADMERAKRFYADAFDATIVAATPAWTSIRVAGVRLGLFKSSGGARTGLHFTVDDLDVAVKEIVAAGGRVVSPPMEPVPGVVIADVEDSERNVVTLTRRGP